MAIIKLSRSGKALQFIIGDGEEDIAPGTVFQVAAAGVAAACGNGSMNGPFMVLTRLPLPVTNDKYPASPVWNPDKGVAKAIELSGSQDPSSTAYVKKREEQKVQSKAKDYSPW